MKVHCFSSADGLDVEMTAGSHVSVQNTVVEGAAGEDKDHPCISVLNRVAVFTGRTVDPGFTVL